MRMELIGGAYAARSVISNAQRCINLFPEPNRKDGPQTMTHYQRPGLRALSLAPTPDVGRGLYRATNGNGYAVVGQNVYSIGANWAMTQIGSLTIHRTNVVSMIDNGTTAVLGDGSAIGYEWPIATNAPFGPIVDPTGIFQGTIKFDYLDTFVLWPLPKSIQFGSTYSNEIVFDATYTAGKTGYADPLQTLYVNRHEILLLGALKSEIWYDAGNPLFPFAILPGAYIEHGLLAPYGITHQDTDVYWLAQSLQGVGYVIRQRGYETRIVSNYALSYAIGQMARNGADLSDCVAYSYIRDGHPFIVFNFQSGDQTWVFDPSVQDPELAWHQRGWTDANGQLHRERPIAHAFINGVNVVQDWQTGALYALDPDYYYDYVGGVAMPIQYTRTFPNIYIGKAPNGQPILANEKALQITKFVADIECGNGPNDGQGNAPLVSLRWSFDRGRTFGQTVLQSMGKLGEYSTDPKWPLLGIGRWPILELNYSCPAQAALNGGWIEAMVLNQ